MSILIYRFFYTFAAFSILIGVAACDLQNSVSSTNKDDDKTSQFGKLTGDGIVIGGSSKSPGVSTNTNGIGVNSFLWRASLDTISFMPLTSADPFGGVIITDWYNSPDVADERFKLTVYILDRQLRADGIKVAVFKQIRDKNKTDWIDSLSNPQTATDLEDIILVRARQLRIKSEASSKQSG